MDFRYFIQMKQKCSLLQQSTLPSIHQFSLPLILQRVAGELQPISAVIGRGAGYSLDRLQVYHRAHLDNCFTLIVMTEIVTH